MGKTFGFILAMKHRTISSKIRIISPLTHYTPQFANINLVTQPIPGEYIGEEYCR